MGPRKSATIGLSSGVPQIGIIAQGQIMDDVELTTAAPEAQSDGSNGANLTAQEVLATLSKEYGPFNWDRRNDPISEIVSVILSQHTSDVNSERTFKTLMDAFGSFQELADADTEAIARCINAGGLAKIKAPRLKEVLNAILEKRGSLDLSFLEAMPLDEAKAWLRQLPGIGPKSAAIVLCFSLGMPAMAVDTHVYRMSKRLGLIGPKTGYEQAHDILEQAVDPEDVYPLHTALIIHGRRVCKAPRPLCGQCVLAGGCPSRHLGGS